MAARYLLDTNILIAAIRGEPVSLLNRLAHTVMERLYLSSVVLGELLTGAAKSRDRAKNRADIAALTHGMAILPFDEHDAEVYAGIRAALKKKGSAIGPYDLQIAAQALARDLVLITDNLRDFRRVPGLKCENWLR